MAKLFVCSFLFVLATCTGNVYAEAIQGGFATNITQRGFLASLQTEGGDRVCGGALHKENIIVTSASCLAFYDVSQLVAGVHDGARIVQIADARKHPKYDPITNENDIAIVKLAESVVAPYLAVAANEPPNDAYGAYIGWDAENVIVDVPVYILSAAKCRSGEYSYSEDEVSDSMLCSVTLNNQACGGLPGSPVVAYDRLVGVLSAGYGCGNKGNPGTFPNAAKFQSWIAEEVKNL